MLGGDDARLVHAASLTVEPGARTSSRWRPRADAIGVMRSQTGSSLVAVLATLALIGGLAAGLVPAMRHHPSAAATPAQHDPGTAARTAVQSIEAAQQRAATTP